MISAKHVKQCPARIPSVLGGRPVPSPFMDIISFQSSQRCCEEGGEETEAQRGEVTGPRAHSW